MLYYGLNAGQGEFDAATSSASSTSRDVEIVVNDTNVTSKAQLLLALENLKNVVLKSDFPL
jgi:uncharacterized protein YfaP (DUF2135 family)